MKGFLNAVKHQSTLHFLIIGLVLTLIYTVLGKQLDKQSMTNSSAPNLISASQDKIAAFLQYREKAFNAQQAMAQLANMTQAQKEQLLADYVLEEVLVRQAKAMELDNDDYVIRSRLVQKMEYLTEGFINQTFEPSEAEIEAHFTTNIKDYEQAANASFSHIYFSSDESTQIQTAIQLLNTGKIAAHEVGESFLFQKHYTKRPIDLIRSHFGDQFAQELFAMQADYSQWQGPIVSDHGIHIVRLKSLSQASIPKLQDVRAQVAQDLRMSKTDQHIDSLFAALVEQYTVVDDTWLATNMTSMVNE